MAGVHARWYRGWINACAARAVGGGVGGDHDSGPVPGRAVRIALIVLLVIAFMLLAFEVLGHARGAGP